MSRPTFLPALRTLIGGPSQPETKSLVVTGLGPASINLSGHQSTTVLPNVLQAIGGQRRADTWDVEKAVSEGYERGVWVYRCVEQMAGDASRRQFRIGRNLGTDKQEILDDHPLYRVLNRRANPHERAREFRKRYGAVALLSKKGVFIEVTKSRAGTINRLDLMHPARVNPIESEDGEYISHFEYTRADGTFVELDTDRVKWVKEPHPLDPLSGVTPLEAAGVSVELDFLSRLYNVSFIKNDSRPGGVLGVDADGLEQDDLDRLERRMEPGVHAAGKVTVLGTGPGGLTYVDTTTRPRDMAYGDASQNAKVEILAAFGIGESVLGNASGRTFDNAEQELYNYWVGPMPPFMDLLTSAFEDDIDDDWDCFLDTGDVQALELPRRRAREEALKEYNAGLRSIDEYRPLADLDPLNTPQGRALWISPAKAPIPANPEDAAVLNGEDPMAAGEDPAAAGDGVPLAAGGRTAAEVVAAARGEGDPSGTAAAAVAEARGAGEVEDLPVSDAAAQAVASARSTDAFDLDVPNEAAAAVAAARMERKSLEDADVVAESPEDTVYDKVAMAVAATLEAEFARHRAVIAARLESPKVRRGTKFWTPAGEADTRGGDDPLDAARAVNAGTLGPSTLATVTPVTKSAAEDAAVAMLTVFAGAGLFGSAAYSAADLARVAAASAKAPAAAVNTILAEVITSMFDDVERVIDRAAAEATTIGSVVAAVTEFYTERAAKEATSVSEFAAYAAINGARESVADMLAPAPSEDLDQMPVVERSWVTRMDDRVREEHADTHGTSLPVGEAFTMPGGTVRYPRDPSAPPHLTFGCRCRLTYHVTLHPRSDGMLLPG